MKDFFKEQLVSKEFTKQDKIKKFVMIIGSAVIIILLWDIISSVAYLNQDYFYSLMILLVIFVGIVIFITIRLISNLAKEYEYAYTSGNLDIDAIMNKSKRKRVFSGYAEEFEIMAHIDDIQHLAMYDSLKTKDFSSGIKKENTYIFVAVYKGKKRKFVIEPCDEILKAMRTDLTPRRMFLKNNYIK